MPDRTQIDEEPRRGLWLYRVDQAAVALSIATALAALTSYWYFRGGSRELIEIDRAAPLEANYVVDINAASWAEFEPLPGLGEIGVRRIVAFREREGPFPNVDALARVEGISDKTVERLRPHLRAGPGRQAP